jgi:hypothetical protein
LETEYALYRFCAITHLSWTQVHFLFIIEDKVFYLTLNGKHALLVPSRLHCCHNSCFASCLFADFTQCPCVALLQGNPEKGREAAAPSFIKKIQEVQGGQEAPHNGGAIIPKDA